MCIRNNSGASNFQDRLIGVYQIEHLNPKKVTKKVAKKPAKKVVKKPAAKKAKK